jgi:hypothetical protein
MRRRDTVAKSVVAVSWSNAAFPMGVASRESLGSEVGFVTQRNGVRAECIHSKFWSDREKTPRPARIFIFAHNPPRSTPTVSIALQRTVT